MGPCRPGRAGWSSFILPAAGARAAAGGAVHQSPSAPPPPRSPPRRAWHLPAPLFQAGRGGGGGGDPSATRQAHHPSCRCRAGPAEPEPQGEAPSCTPAFLRAPGLRVTRAEKEGDLCSQNHLRPTPLGSVPVSSSTAGVGSLKTAILGPQSHVHVETCPPRSCPLLVCLPQLQPA